MKGREKPRLLYVEDETDLANVTKQYLEAMGFDVTWCETSEQAYSLFTEQLHGFNLTIIDVQLPDNNGFELAKRLIALDKNTYFIFLTARKEKKDKILGLEIGASDYITKPYDIDELVLRIRNIIRRQESEGTADAASQQADSDVIHMEDVVLNTKLLSLTVAGKKETTLTMREAELLAYFYKNRNQIVSREDLLVNIWGENDYFLGRSLDVFISRLRKLLRDSRYVTIENIYGVGFVCRIADSL